MDKQNIALIRNTLFDYFKKCEYINVLKVELENFIYRNANNNLLVRDPLYCSIPIDLTFLMETSGVVANILMTNPLLVQEICKTLILILLGYYEPKNSIQSDQIITRIVIINQTRALGSDYFKNLCSRRGVLSEFTYYPQSFIRSTNWKCTNNCYSVIKENLPNVTIICPFCSNPLIEITTNRTMGLYIEGQLIHPDMRRANETLMVRFFNFRMEDARKSPVELGSEYILTGVWRESHFEVWGCAAEEVVPWPLSYSSKLESLHARMGGHPQAFVRLLSRLIYADRCPPGRFHHLRMGLLLSLASIRSETPLPLVAACEDEDKGIDLMIAAMQLAERCVRFRYPFNQIGVEFKTATGRLTGGALTMARGGVCYIGDVEPYPIEVVDVIGNALEFGIPIQGIAGHSVPLKCAIWSINKIPPTENHEENLQTLHNIFGVQWIGDTENELTNPSQENENDPHIPMEEIKQYISSISFLNVSLTNDANVLVQKYITSSRKARGWQFAETAERILTGLIQAHARLDKRVFATPDDVLSILQLYEIGTGQTIDMKQDLAEFSTWLDNFINYN